MKLTATQRMEEEVEGSDKMTTKSAEELGEVLKKFVGEKWQSQLTNPWNQNNMKELLEKVKNRRHSASSDELKSQNLLDQIFVFCEKLSRVNDPWLHTWGKEVLQGVMDNANSCRILSINVQLLDNASQMKYDEGFVSLTCLLDCINICLKSGAVPSSNDVEKLAALPDAFKSSTHLKKYLQILRLSLVVFRNENSHYVIKCNMDILKDMYHISKDIAVLGRDIINKAGTSQEACSEGRSFISNVLSLTSQDAEEGCVMAVLSLPNPENWLQRTQLHYMAMLVDDLLIFQSLPRSFVDDHINKLDLHGCSPLHLAYLHNHYSAVNYLLTNGASDDIVDNYGMKPKDLETKSNISKSNISKLDISSILMKKNEKNWPNEGNNNESQMMKLSDYAVQPQDHDSNHQKLCRDVMDADSGILEKLMPMLVLRDSEAESLAAEAKELVKRVIDQTKYKKYVKEIVVTGSMKDKLKAGRLEEVDIQIWFHHHTNFNNLAWNLPEDFYKSIALISWNDVHLRPVGKGNPLECIWEGLGQLKGMKIEIDLVPVFERIEPDYDAYFRQGRILQYPQIHRRVDFLKWNKRAHRWFKNPRLSYFAFEWNVADSLPVGCRLGILIAKALLQAYDWTNNKAKHSSMSVPITSYMMKTAVLHILGGHIVCPDEKPSDEAAETMGGLQNCNGGIFPFKQQNFDGGHLDEHLGDWREKKIEFEFKSDQTSNPKWVEESDVIEHAEQGRIWARQIFRTLKQFAMQNQRLPSYWDGFYTIAFDPNCENEYIADICDSLLERTEKSSFHGVDNQNHKLSSKLSSIENYNFEDLRYCR